MDAPSACSARPCGIGPNAEALILAVLSRRPHPEQGLSHLPRRVAAVSWHRCRSGRGVSLRAVEIGALSYASVASILKHRLDRSASPQAADGTPLLHDNIRGSRYYH